MFLPGKSHGQRSLEGYSPWVCKESDTTLWLNNNNIFVILHVDRLQSHRTSFTPYYSIYELFGPWFPHQERKDNNNTYFIGLVWGWNEYFFWIKCGEHDGYIVSCLRKPLLCVFTFCHKGGVIFISEVIDISPGNLDSSLSSSSPVCLMMYSAYKLNKQGDNIQPWRTPFPICNQP